MQDLVRVGVADAAEDVRIGQRALERVVLAHERRAEVLQRRAEHLDPARVVLRERLLAAHHVHRRAPLRAFLGEEQRPVLEVERGQAAPAGQRRGSLAPAQPPGDHQVDHEEELALEADHDALAEPAQLDHAPTGEGLDRRLDRAQHEHAAQPHAVEHAPLHVSLERAQVDLDVGQLGHRGLLRAGGATSRPAPPPHRGWRQRHPRGRTLASLHGLPARPLGRDPSARAASGSRELRRRPTSGRKHLICHSPSSCARSAGARE